MKVMKILIQIVLISTLFKTVEVIAMPGVEALTNEALELGTVAEIIPVESYTYIKIEELEIWLATAPLTVSVGDKIRYSGGMEMRDFHSRTLDRTFESIIFVQNTSVVARDMDNLHGDAVEGSVMEVSGMPLSAPVTAPGVGDILLLPGGMSIEEILAQSEELDGQTIKLRAKVMKVSEQIKGRNWITLQDGTGHGGDTKLLATSDEIVAPGDTVIAEGLISNEVDIGSGYKYKVLLEQTTFKPGKN